MLWKKLWILYSIVYVESKFREKNIGYIRTNDLKYF